jgi:hypothetical protein
LKKTGRGAQARAILHHLRGKTAEGLRITPDAALRALLSGTALEMYGGGESMSLWDQPEQLSLFAKPALLTGEEVQKCLTGQM